MFQICLNPNHAKIFSHLIHAGGGGGPKRKQGNTDILYIYIFDRTIKPWSHKAKLKKKK